MPDASADPVSLELDSLVCRERLRRPSLPNSKLQQLRLLVSRGEAAGVERNGQGLRCCGQYWCARLRRDGLVAHAALVRLADGADGR